MQFTLPAQYPLEAPTVVIATDDMQTPSIRQTICRITRDLNAEATASSLILHRILTLFSPFLTPPAKKKEGKD